MKFLVRNHCKCISWNDSPGNTIAIIARTFMLFNIFLHTSSLGSSDNTQVWTRTARRQLSSPALHPPYYINAVKNGMSINSSNRIWCSLFCSCPYFCGALLCGSSACFCFPFERPLVVNKKYYTIFSRKPNCLKFCWNAAYHHRPFFLSNCHKVFF